MVRLLQRFISWGSDGWEWSKCFDESSPMRTVFLRVVPLRWLAGFELELDRVDPKEASWLGNRRGWLWWHVAISIGPIRIAFDYDAKLEASSG
jgi:hypothetical protein